MIHPVCYKEKCCHYPNGVHSKSSGMSFIQKSIMFIQARTLGGFRGFGQTTHSLVDVREGTCIFMALGHLCMAIASGQAVVRFKLA